MTIELYICAINPYIICFSPNFIPFVFHSVPHVLCIVSTRYICSSRSLPMLLSCFSLFHSFLLSFLHSIHSFHSFTIPFFHSISCTTVSCVEFFVFVYVFFFLPCSLVLTLCQLCASFLIHVVSIPSSTVDHPLFYSILLSSSLECHCYGSYVLSFIQYVYSYRCRLCFFPSFLPAYPVSVRVLRSFFFHCLVSHQSHA